MTKISKRNLVFRFFWLHLVSISRIGLQQRASITLKCVSNDINVSRSTRRYIAHLALFEADATPARNLYAVLEIIPFSFRACFSFCSCLNARARKVTLPACTCPEYRGFYGTTWTRGRALKGMRDQPWQGQSTWTVNYDLRLLKSIAINCLDHFSRWSRISLVEKSWWSNTFSSLLKNQLRSNLALYFSYK